MALLIAFTLMAAISAQTPATSLRIVVLEGEDAVNIVQQKTAVRPLVEVRDRNNLPVSGATVTFTIGSGQPAAFAGGAQTLTVTTNASGQAAASGLSATGAGKVGIQVQAAHQGQIASAAISQTNFATVAAAAAAGAAATTAGVAAGSTGGAGAAGAAGATGAAGAGGGISATTIAIVGGAVAGGAVVAQQAGVLGGGGDELTAYTGALSGQYIYTSVSSGPFGTSACNFTRSLTGTLKIELNENGTSGKATVETEQSELSVTGTCFITGNSLAFGASEIPVGGGPSALAFTHSEASSVAMNDSTRTDRFTFNGSLSGSAITGSLGIETTSRHTSTSPNGTSVINGSGSLTVSVTLQR